jgi:two-component system, response regulator PdtaR
MSDLETLQDHVLIVEDEFLIVMGLQDQIEDGGWQVCATAGTANDAIAAAQKYRPSIVLMDVRLQGEKDGIDAARAIQDSVGSKVIFITGSREPATLARIERCHPSAVLFKPISDRQLREALENARRR